MDLGKIVTGSFAISIILIMWAAYLKITHSENSGILLSLGLFTSIVFVVTAIYEVRKSDRIDNIEKTLWTLAFIFLSSFGALAYILFGRKRITSK